MNNVTIAGNLTGNPEMRFTQSGIPFVNFTIAVNKSWKDQAGEWQEETSFIDGTLWRGAAERVADSLSKGDRVIATGRLKQESWEKDGQKRSKVKLDVFEIGPSLKYATAVVTRAQRDATTGSQGGVSQPAARDDYGPDEAPF